MTFRASFHAFTAVALCLLTTSGSYGQINTIADFDFDNTPTGGFGFSGPDNPGGNPLNVSYDNNAFGNGGFVGRVRINETNATLLADAAFAGGGLTGFDFALDGQFVSGSIAQENIDRVNLSFDIATLGGATLNGVRLQPNGMGSGAFPLDLGLGALDTAGAFQSFNIPLSTLDASDFITGLNSLGTTGFTFQANINKAGVDPNETFVSGHGFSLDNILLTAEADPTAPLVRIDAAAFAQGGNFSSLAEMISPATGPRIIADTVNNVILLRDPLPVSEDSNQTEGGVWVKQFGGGEVFEIPGGGQAQFEMDVRLLPLDDPVNQTRATEIDFRINVDPDDDGDFDFAQFRADISGLEEGATEFVTISVPFSPENYSFGDFGNAGDQSVIDAFGGMDPIKAQQFGLTTFNAGVHQLEIQEWRIAPVNATAGDFDGDGDVDGGDFLEWQRTNGTPEGLTDFLDNYGNNANPSVASAGAVPEPSTALLLLGSLSAMLSVLRRRA